MIGGTATRRPDDRAFSMPVAPDELDHARRIVAAWRRPPSELWLVAHSRGDDAAAEMVRQFYATVGPLSGPLEAMLNGADADDRIRAARTIYRIQTMIAGAYVDGQRELEQDRG